MRTRVLILTLLMFLPPVFTYSREEDRVDAAIASGVEYLRENRVFETEEKTGPRVLALLALVRCGLSENDPLVKKGLRLVPILVSSEKNDYLFTYSGALYLMTCRLIRDKKFRRAAPMVLARLERIQEKNGGWGDTSRTQFAAMGLKAAWDMNLGVDLDRVRRARKFLLKTARKDGTYAYTYPSSDPSRPAMTLAGISSLKLFDQMLSSGMAFGVYPDRTVEKMGLVSLDVKNAFSDFYTTYGIERLGLYSGLRKVENVEWFPRVILRVLLSRELDGTFGDEYWFKAKNVGTGFGLLLLSRARVPLLLQKLDVSGAGRFDAANLAGYALEEHGLRGDWQWISVFQPEYLGDAPVVMVTGKGDFKLPENFAGKLRDFVIDDSGFILAGAVKGDAEFDRAFRREMKKVFPEASFAPLPEGYPAVALAGPTGEDVKIEHLKISCRSRVVYFPDGITEPLEQRRMYTRPISPGAKRIRAAAGFLLFASSFRPLVKKGKKLKKTVRPETAPGLRPVIAGVSLQNGGAVNTPELDWLFSHFNRAVGTIVTRRVEPLPLAGKNIYAYPSVYLRVVKKVSFTKNEADNLREYLLRGGFLIAEVCGGYSETRTALVSEIEKALAGRMSIEKPKRDGPVFSGVFSVKKPGVLKVVEKTKVPEKEWIRVIRRKNGTLAGVVFGLDVSASLSRGAGEATLGFDRKTAYALLGNSVYFFLTRPDPLNAR